MRQAIDDATERVAKNGYQRATSKDVMLAGFGYLAERLERGTTARIELSGRLLFPTGVILGGIIIGIAQAFLG